MVECDVGRSLLERAAQEGRRSGAAGGPEESFSLLPELGLTIQEEKPEPRTWVSFSPQTALAFFRGRLCCGAQLTGSVFLKKRFPV